MSWKDDRKAYYKAYRQANLSRLSAQLKIYTSSLKGRFNSYKGDAKRRDLSFDLALEDFEIFWNSQCSYCGQDINGIGIDRVDSSIGYTLKNCVPCCEMCNRMKLDHPEEEWFQHMLLILKTQGIT